jgi:hypothetical protein
MLGHHDVLSDVLGRKTWTRAVNMRVGVANTGGRWLATLNSRNKKGGDLYIFQRHLELLIRFHRCTQLSLPGRCMVDGDVNK